MPYNKVLVAYDRSEHAKDAFDAALEMVECGIAHSIVVLYVTEASRGSGIDFEAAADALGVDIISLGKIERDEVTQEVNKMAFGYEDKVEIKVRIGNPKDEILRAAAAYKCGLIVVGSRGLGAIRGVLGSVSYAVLRDAEVPVLVMK